MSDWLTPKEDWTTDDGILDSDLNRIEGNTNFLNQNYLRKQISGFQFDANNGATTANGIVVRGGRAGSSKDAADTKDIDFNSSAVTKLFSSTDWASGSGTSSPCKAPGVTVSADTWYFIFVLYNPTTQAIDVAVDSRSDGGNISTSAIETAGFTAWKRIGSFRTDSSSNIIPTHMRDQYHYISNTNVVTKFIGTGSTTPVLVDLSSLIPKDGLVSELNIVADLHVYRSDSGVSTSPAHLTGNTLRIWDTRYYSSPPAVPAGAITTGFYVDAAGAPSGYPYDIRFLSLLVRRAHDTIYILPGSIDNGSNWNFKVVGYLDECKDSVY